ncbi:MAG: methyl-accepting chemotaxis protein [Desulfuromonadales bacterium]|nr:methyl-accepting chemotaxis protein [Desulfuromonadales bacterium]
MTLRIKMSLLAAIVFIGFLTSILTGLAVVRQVRVGGEIYGTIKAYKALMEGVALLKSDLNQVRAESFNLILENDPDKINQIEGRLGELKAGIDSRFDATSQLTLEEEKTLSLQDAQTTWSEFAQTVTDELIPAIRAANRDQALTLASGIQRMRYERFSDQLDGLVAVLSLEIDELETAATATAQRRMMFSAMIGGGLFLVVVVATVLISRSIASAVLSGARFAQTVARGDLTGSLAVKSRDEIGDLTQALNTMVTGLSAMVHRVGASAGQLTTISADILTASKQVISAAELQSGAVQETSSAIDEIGYSIKSVAEGVNHLAGATEENTSSTLEMASSIEEVAKNVDVLAAAVEEIGSSIAQMAASIGQVAASADTLKQTSEITSSSINEMDASIREVEENAIATAAIAEEVRRDAETGKSAVDSTIAGMQEIKESAAVSAEVIKTLSGKVEKIGDILSVIDEVVAQINLLSLNASIIAAQAGEHGKGFAVVADEIKKLSERTGLSTREIAVVIEGVQVESRRAVTAIDQAESSIVEGERLSQLSGEALAKIVDGVERTTVQMGGIVRSTREQARGSNMIRKAMDNVADMIRQIAVATSQQEKGSDQIMAASERMKNLTAQVRSSTHEQSQSSAAIAHSTEKMATMIEQIKRACDEQGKGSRSIVHAIENIRSATEVNLNAVQVMDVAVAGLGEQTETLLHEMEAFQVRQIEGEGIS